MGVAGSLVVKIGADIAGIQRDAKRGADALGSLEGATKTLGLALKGLVVGAVAHELQSMVSGAMDAVDANAKLSRQLGGTIDGLQGLQLAASEAGVSAGALKSATEMLNKRLGEAARRGAGEAHDAFTRLNLDARELGAMDLDLRMAAIADAIQDAGLSSQGTADALAKMGVEQGEVTRLLLDGGSALRAAKETVDQLGLSLSEVDAIKVEAANDAMGRVKLASTAIAQKLAVELSPMLTMVSNQFLDMASDSDAVKESVETTAYYFSLVAGQVGNIGRVARISFGTVETAVDMLEGAVAASMLGAVKSVSWFVDQGIEMVNQLGSALAETLNVEFTPIALTGDSKMIKDIDEVLGAILADVKASVADLNGIIDEDWPSTKMAKFFKAFKEEANATAEAAVRARRDMQGLADGGELSEEEKKKLKAYREQLGAKLEALHEYTMDAEQLEKAHHAKRLETLQEALANNVAEDDEFKLLSEQLEQAHQEKLAEIRKNGRDKDTEAKRGKVLAQLNVLREQCMTEEELESARHANSLANLNAALDARLVSSNEYAKLAESLEKRHMDELAGIRKKGMDKVADVSITSAAFQVRQVTGLLQSLTSNAARENKAMFETHKAFAIADAVLSGAAGVAQTMGAYPFPINAAFAAAHAAMAAAQIGVISAKQFEGSSRNVAAPATAVPAPTSGGGQVFGGSSGGGFRGGSQTISINLTGGDPKSRESIMELIELFNDAIQDGARLVIA